MRILKKATQHNVNINKDMYDDYELKEMLENHEIFYLDENLNECYESKFYNETFRIFLDDMKEIRVIYKDGSYMNVVVSQENKMYYITL